MTVMARSCSAILLSATFESPIKPPANAPINAPIGPPTTPPIIAPAPSPIAVSLWASFDGVLDVEAIAGVQKLATSVNAINV